MYIELGIPLTSADYSCYNYLYYYHCYHEYHGNKYLFCITDRL